MPRKFDSSRCAKVELWSAVWLAARQSLGASVVSWRQRAGGSAPCGRRRCVRLGGVGAAAGCQRGVAGSRRGAGLVNGLIRRRRLVLPAFRRLRRPRLRSWQRQGSARPVPELASSRSLAAAHRAGSERRMAPAASVARAGAPIAKDELQRRVAARRPRERLVIDAECSEHAQSATDGDHRGQHRHDHQTDVRKHSTSQNAHARSKLKQPRYLAFMRSSRG